MQKTLENLPSGNDRFHDSDNSARIFRYWQINSLLGSLLTVLETFGLPEKQEDAAKSLIRKEVWKYWGDSCIEIPREKDEEIFILLGMTDPRQREATIG